MKQRYALRIAYDGAAFRGFQRQPGLPTVQEALEDALRPLGLAGRLDVAARTDAGVSAIDQVVSFWARATHHPDALRAAVNAATPPPLLCLAAARVPSSFHARATATSRTYVYLVGAPPPEPLRAVEAPPRAWALPDARAFPALGEPVRLDVGAMREALGACVGTHDFTGFARPGEQKDPVRTVLRAEVLEAADGTPLWAVVLEGRGFLRAMVRHLVGTAVTVGLGLAPPARLGELLAARGRYRGVRAPGWGLALARVRYEADPFGAASASPDDATSPSPIGSPATARR